MSTDLSVRFLGRNVKPYAFAESPGAMFNYYWNMISGKSKKKNNEEKQK